MLVCISALAQTVHINGQMHEATDGLDMLLNEELPKHSGELVVVDLEAGAQYFTTEPINLNGFIYSKTVINGNYATIASHHTGWTIYKDAELSYGLTGSADTQVELHNIAFEGGGSAVFVRSTYQSKFTGITVKNMKDGIWLEFCLQALVSDCMMSFSGTGVYLGTTPNTGSNAAQCNAARVQDCRLFAKRGGAKNGVHVLNSNLVTVEGMIIEGNGMESGILCENYGTTVTNFDVIGCHFEGSEYTSACVTLQGMWIPITNIDRMYYHGKSGDAIKTTFTHGYSKVRVSNVGWFGGWTISTSPYDRRGVSVGTWWDFVGMPNELPTKKKLKMMFGVKPYYLYVNGSSRVRIH